MLKNKEVLIFLIQKRQTMNNILDRCRNDKKIDFCCECEKYLNCNENKELYFIEKLINEIEIKEI